MTIALSLATMVMIEVNQLANDLPRYQTTLSEKMRALHDKVGSAGVLKNASKMLKDLDRELRSGPAKLKLTSQLCQTELREPRFR